MKKLLIALLFGSLFFISCSSSTSSSSDTESKTTTEEKKEEEVKSIPRSEWDKDDIAYTNTKDCVGYSYMRKLLDERYKNQNGIIGMYSDSDNGRTEHIQFFDTGYYKSDSTYYVNNSASQNNDEGTFVIHKSDKTDDYFVVELKSEKGHGKEKYFYQTDEDFLYLTPWLDTEDRQGVIEP